MNNMRRRRESVASVYRKTTKFLTSNTANFLKKKPGPKKSRILMKTVEDFEDNAEENFEKVEVPATDEDDLGERDLDFYLGVSKRESYWRDPVGKEQIRKDYLVYHCGITEEDYDKNYKKNVVPKVSYILAYRSCNDGHVWWASPKKKKKKVERLQSTNEDDVEDMIGYLNELRTCGSGDMIEGVRIKEVSEGRPCDNCPELCPGFIPHAWRYRLWNPVVDMLDNTYERDHFAAITEIRTGEVAGTS
ncbi:unnamed protein product [Chrysodeixis includens]|uniref:Uncharacterized protein n=1 Tax=Chrysodeixis includens TaxID=689277 RepID=A0A9N8PZQ6_CHRIL|nr:unnamed protein product [Chrysodeixis includens]